MEMSIDNFEVLCRLCASETSVQERVQIFEGIGNKRKEIYTKITACLPVDISEQDLLPKYMCVECLNKLESYSNFRECCIRTETFLKDTANKRILLHDSLNLKNEYCTTELIDSLTPINNYKCELQVSNKDDVNKDKKHAENIVCEPSIYFSNVNTHTESNEDDQTSDVHNKSLEITLSDTLALKESTASITQMPNFLTRKVDALAAFKKPSVGTKSAFVIHSTKKKIPLVICSRNSQNKEKSKVTSGHEQKMFPEIIQPPPKAVPKPIGSSKLLYKNTSFASSSKPKQVKMTMYRCKQCQVLFQTHQEFLRHVETVHEKVFKCDACDQAFNSPQALEFHQEKFLHKLYLEKPKEEEIFKCDNCGKEFPHKRNLRLHEKVHLNERPYPCTYCDKAFTSTSARNKHIQVHEKRWSHVCSYCGKGFVDRVHFKYHVQKHHTGERPFPCDQCEKKFVRKQDYLTHMASMHSTEPRQCYKCEICGKTFTNKNYLRTHTQNHVIPLETRKKFKCTICEAVFCSKKSLSQHTLSHTGELPYECDLCKKRFSNKQGLEIHLLIHSGLKTFVCEVCGKAFALRNTLICHRRTHTGERPYQCDICDQRFTQKSSLNAHRKRH